jgi:cysteine synthase A
MPETMSAERIQILKSYGAEVVLTPEGEGMMGAVKRAEAMVKDAPGAFMPQQFNNPANPEVHRRTTAQEILRAVEGDVDAFVAGVGTGGTITGVGEALKKRFPAITIVAVEPQSSAVLSGHPPGRHMIQGIGAGFVPQVLNRSVIDTVLQVSDEQAHDMAKRLTHEEGLFVGISSGAACWGALKIAKDLGAGKTVVTVFPDTGERYLSIQPYFED